jgi:hypothetical protein
MSSARTIAIAVAAVLGAGCYKYVPVEFDELSVGSQARARVTVAQAATIGEVTGSAERLIQGEVVGREAQSILFSVPTTSVATGLDTRLLHQRIAIPRSGILEVETRKLDRFRTFGIIGVAAVAATYIIASQFIAADDPDGNTRPNPDQIVVPISRF